MDSGALVDAIRRRLRDDLARRLTDSGIDVALGEHVAADAGELLDVLLVDYQIAAVQLSRHDAAVVGAHLFGSGWSRILPRVLPLSARAHGASVRDAERLGYPLSSASA